VSDSILSPRVTVHSFSHVTRSVLMHRVEVGRSCQIHRAIIDKGVFVPAGVHIGVDHEHDRARGFTVTDSGITIVPKGAVLTS
jgi:glucose-1-phosphate adenylyltransferase